MNLKKMIITGSESSSVILLRIIPTRDPNQKIEKQQSENFNLDLPFLVDQDRNLYDCSHNTEQCEVLMDYFKK